MWQVRMLGRFEVVSQEAAQAAFRSRKVGSLLAYLALNKGREISNGTLHELLWPDSDGDKQSQNLRRAVADLRDALGDNALIRTEHGKTTLGTDAFETDVERFASLLQTSSTNPGYELRVAEALALYGGPLLSPLEEDWAYPYRRQYEEVYCRGVDTLCTHLIERGQPKDAIRFASAATVLAPLREEPFIALIRAYAASDNQAMALQQFEALEKMLDDEFGQTPSDAAVRALDSRLAQQQETKRIADTESRFYIEREADGIVNEALEHGEAVVLVYGPRQTGKTSLLSRSADIRRARSDAVVVTDFQAMSKSEMERPSTMYRTLIHSFATQLHLNYEPSWNEWIGANSNLDAMIGTLLKQADVPITWAMDEVDRLFGTDYADDFFGLVRSWHNRRALDPGGPWRNLSLLISYATEAHLFITDLNQSPFNVGVRANLTDFTTKEVAELATRHGERAAPHAANVHAITRGHPYLTRKALAFITNGGSPDELASAAATESGPFGDHLKHLLHAIRKNESTELELRRLVNNEGFSDETIVARLIAAGVLAPSGSYRVPIYESYLRVALA